MYLPCRGSHCKLARADRLFARLCTHLDHLVVGLEARIGDLGDGERLVVGFRRRDDWRVGGKRKVNARIRNKIRLELQISIHLSIDAFARPYAHLSKIDIESAVETERCRDRRHNLQRAVSGGGKKQDASRQTCEISRLRFV